MSVQTDLVPLTGRHRDWTRIRWMSERTTGHGDLLPRDLATAFIDQVADEYPDIVHWLDP
jgi:hypothetical protein